MLTPNDPEHEFNLKLVVSKETGIKIEGTTFFLKKTVLGRPLIGCFLRPVVGWRSVVTAPPFSLQESKSCYKIRPRFIL